MTDGNRTRRNRRLREEMYPVIEKMPVGTRIEVSTLSKRYSNGARHVTTLTTGNLLRELDTVRRVSCGVWERVEVTP